MSLRWEALADLVGATGPGPSTDRGLLSVLVVVGIVAVGVNWWVAHRFGSEPWPDWAVSVIMMSFVFGIMGVVVGGFHLWRHSTHRLLAVLCVGINGLAVVMPYIGAF